MTAVTTGLTVTAAGSVVELAAGTAYDPAVPGVAKSTQLVRSSRTSGSFQVQFGNRTSADIPFNASATVFRQTLINLLGHDRVDVIDNGNTGGVRSWTIEIGFSLGAQPTFQAITQGDRTQHISGFNGTIRNVSDVVYGPGVNLLVGSNASIESTKNSFADLMAGAASFGDFVSDFFGSGIAGRCDLFYVGGNLVPAAKDWLISQNETASKLQETLEEDYPFVNSLIESALGPWFDGTVAPGAHVLAGLSGGDTYTFEGIWGAAAILEAPDVEVVGAAIP